MFGGRLQDGTGGQLESFRICHFAIHIYHLKLAIYLFRVSKCPMINAKCEMINVIRLCEVSDHRLAGGSEKHHLP